MFLPVSLLRRLYQIVGTMVNVSLPPDQHLTDETYIQFPWYFAFVSDR
jgi:hypothetical protein